MHKDVAVATLCRCAKNRYLDISVRVAKNLIASRTNRIAMPLRRFVARRRGT